MTTVPVTALTQAKSTNEVDDDGEWLDFDTDVDTFDSRDVRLHADENVFLSDRNELVRERNVRDMKRRKESSLYSTSVDVTAILGPSVTLLGLYVFSCTIKYKHIYTSIQKTSFTVRF